MTLIEACAILHGREVDGQALPGAGAAVEGGSSAAPSEEPHSVVSENGIG